MVNSVFILSMLLKGVQVQMLYSSSRKAFGRLRPHKGSHSFLRNGMGKDTGL